MKFLRTDKLSTPDQTVIVKFYKDRIFVESKGRTRKDRYHADKKATFIKYKLMGWPTEDL